ncbi:unnamed protein product [Oikopleura dioica]|uniref:Uncharacterized protein n=1 Tax=Oikopleura dioica TaxID=34765 RepID=E4WUN3_OIKDI|nr:unnamed protein product [Oikopleura dioica]
MCRGTAIKNRCRAVPRHQNFDGAVPCRCREEIYEESCLLISIPTTSN